VQNLIKIFNYSILKILSNNAIDILLLNLVFTFLSMLSLISLLFCILIFHIMQLMFLIVLILPINELQFPQVHYIIKIKIYLQFAKLNNLRRS